ncbi:MAG TPA: OmpA family protein [Vineibacter sp.]|nr:OmpA family protein [Vineibacter sp.]
MLLVGACETPPPCPPTLRYPGPGIVDKGTVFFDPGAERISPTSARTVQALVETLKAYPHTKIYASTHADRAGDEAANYFLSKRRGEALRQSLVELGIEPARFAFTPYGDGSPLVPTRRGEGHPQNRRAEFIIPQLGWPPRGYREQDIRCLFTGRLLVPVGTP